MNEIPIFISTTDQARLRQLLRPPVTSSPAIEQLRAELDRAVIIDPSVVPPHVVTLGAVVELEDLDTGEIETYTLTLPDDADIEERRLSILAPIGTAVIGYAAGHVVSWQTPGGPRRIRIRGVTQPPASRTPVGFSLPLPLGVASAPGLIDSPMSK